MRSYSTITLLLLATPLLAAEPERPNILWISTEDMSPYLGCYGDEHAKTPNIDALAKRSVRFENVFANVPVCSPARSGLISGCYPTSLGTHHMRCEAVPPANVELFTYALRRAGYECFMGAIPKTEYQFTYGMGFPCEPASWDWAVAPPGRSRTAEEKISKKLPTYAPWRHADGKRPWFSVINVVHSHESFIWRLVQPKGPAHHDPAKLRLPKYIQDTPENRQDWAIILDAITLADEVVGQVLENLEEDGLADNTIIWVWGDHGTGTFRGKRFIYDSGTRVPLLIHVPPKYADCWSLPEQQCVPGAVRDDLISFADFAPTLLSMAGIKPPESMQGRAFGGPHKKSPRDYVFLARGFNDVYREDSARAIRTNRFKLIRSFMPDRAWSPVHNGGGWVGIGRRMAAANKAGELPPHQAFYFRPRRPFRELYDLKEDPDEINNLADDPKYRQTLEELESKLCAHMLETRDVGLLTRDIFDKMDKPFGVKPARGGVMAAKRHKTSAPSVMFRDNQIVLSCSTPGATVAYKPKPAPKSKRDPKPVFPRDGRYFGGEIYQAPFSIEEGVEYVAQAFRLGFNASDPVTFRPGTDDIKSPSEPSDDWQHWSKTLRETDILERLLELKKLDGSGAKAVPAYVAALADPHPSMQFWGAWGLRWLGGDPALKAEAKEKIDTLLESAPDDQRAKLEAAKAILSGKS